MKNKHLLLLSILLSQAAPVWSMTLEDEMHDIRQRVQATVSQNVAQNQETIVVLGPTGSGKTTLINLLADKKFEAQAGVMKGRNTFNPICLNPLPDFVPNSKNSVGTTLPAAWKSSNGAIFWDCPGFGDPRGAKDDIINAFTIHETLKKGTLKFLLLTEESFITGTRATGFLKLIKEATDILPDDQQLAQSLSVLMTKQREITNLPEEITQNILTLSEKDQPLLTPRVRKFLEFLTKNPKRMSFLPSPTVAGTYAPDLSPLRESIKITSGCVSPKSKIVVSSDAKLLVSSYAQTLNAQIGDLISAKGDASVVKYCNSQVENHQGSAEKLRNAIIDTKKYLNDFKNGLSNIAKTQSNNLATTLDSLFTKQITQLLPTVTPPMKKMIEALFFLKNIKSDITYNVSGWQNTSSTLVDKIDVLTKNPEVQFQQNILTLKGLFVGTSDVEKALQAHHQHQIKRVDVFGLNTLFFDKDLTCAGLSLNLIAPRWKVIQKTILNLNGLNGTAGTHGVSPGEPGRPGGPGGNAGNIYGKAVSCNNPSNLVFNVNGGVGGKGGNGKLGSNGTNGRDGNPLLKTSSKDNKHYYEDRGTYGKEGQNGGKGGHGGTGGHKGYVVIDGVAFGQVTTSDGAIGTHGTPGTGGKGGVHGRHCQGIHETGRTKQVEQEIPSGASQVGQGLAAAATPFIFTPAAPVAIFTTLVGAGLSCSKEKIYHSEPLPDIWHIRQGHQAAVGRADDGKTGDGSNTNGQQKPIANSVLNKNDALNPYKTDYNNAKKNPVANNFVRDFPNL